MAKRKDFDIEIREELSRTVTVKAETLGDASFTQCDSPLCLY